MKCQLRIISPISAGAGDFRRRTIISCSCICHAAAWDRLWVFPELVYMHCELLPAMRPDTASAKLEFAAMDSPLSGIAIGVGLVGPEPSHVLRITGRSFGVLGGTKTCAKDQQDHPSEGASHRRLSYLYGDHKTVVPETQLPFVPKPECSGPMIINRRVRRLR
jgi:hypothetical protein